MAQPNADQESGRSKLLRAAWDLFLSKGYAETGVAQILEAARLQPPTLYYPFGDTERLYMAVVEGSLAQLGERIRAGSSPDSSVEFGLMAASAALMDPKEADVIQLRRDSALLSKAEHRERLHRLVFEAVYEPIMGILVRAAASGRVQGQSYDRMTQTFIMGALGLRPAYSLQPSSVGGASEWWAERFLAAMAPTR